MARPIDALLSRVRRGRARPTETLGAPGTAVYGGYVQEDERNVNLSSREERYKTFSETLANASIVAAGTRYFLNLVAKAEWSFSPADVPDGQMYADLCEGMLTDDPDTPWHRIVRRAAMYRFYGFSVQEWTARRRADGRITLADVAPRAQLTCDRWDIDVEGRVLGVLQRSPQDAREIYLPRQKLLYLVDDTLSDSPEGLGLFRHLVAPAQRLFRYEQLEGFGFETDLRGIPIGRGPFTELSRLQEGGELTAAQRTRAEAPIRSFIKNHIKTAKIGLLLDSMVYETKDEKGAPSGQRMWDVELMKGSATSFAENAAAIERLNREMARILGVEQLMLGSGNVGSFALSKDKTNSFFLLVDGALTEIKEQVRDDLIDPLWQLNGWPEDARPEPSPEAVRHTDVEQVAATLRDMATAGAVLSPDDPVVGEVRDLMGVSRPPEVSTSDAEDASLPGAQLDGGQAADGELPADQTQEGRE
jgi:hypothetical protein